MNTLHNFRAHLIPAGMHASDVEDAADARLLTEVKVKAPNGRFAAKTASALMGLPVHRVERVEEDELIAA